jgi:hypothetical protein
MQQKYGQLGQRRLYINVFRMYSMYYVNTVCMCLGICMQVNTLIYVQYVYVWICARYTLYTRQAVQGFI